MSRAKKIVLGVAVVFVVGVISARIAAPHYLVEYANETLDGLDGYSGTIDDVDLHIWRGAYKIEGIEITKDGASGPLPFVSVRELDISVHWDALLNGSIVAELELREPSVNYSASQAGDTKEDRARKEREAKKVQAGESSWQQRVKDLVPLKINRIEIVDGAIHYRDRTAEPAIDLAITKFRGRLSNLTNSDELSESMVATAKFQGVAMDSGHFELDARIDPYAEQPKLDLNAKLEELEMTELNEFLRAYAKVDAERGTMSVYTEVSTSDGRFEGYVKPLVHDLRVMNWSDEDKGVLTKTWETLAEGVSELFENRERQQIGTRIPFSGQLEDPQADLGTTVLFVLRNAFIEALQTGLEHSLSGGGELSARSGNE